ncbi:MAG: T9SS type A sorting domain-containing protein [Vicingaceae bacterium]|nr:T9SS type A sorting domain-containing protein [Vicingaceae bacterium]
MLITFCCAKKEVFPKSYLICVYNVTVTDANGCTSNVSNITITEPTALAGSLTSQTNVACNGGTNGSATVSATGGTAPYTYLWSNAATSATATGLAAGNYNVTITDANGCTTNVSNITITEPTALTSSISSQTNVSCNGGTNGSATVSATGGTTPYTYLWSNAATTATATGLAAGNYTVTITDANACTSVQNVTITEPAIITGTDVQTACNTFTWIDNNTYTANNNTATHTIVSGAANGCDSIVTLNLTINNSATSTDVQTACNTFTWIDNNTYTANNNTATHTIVSGAANGCDSIVTLDLTITTIDNNTTLNTNTISANQNGASYQWLDCDNGNAVISGETSQSFTPTATGNYAVEITLGSCVDTSACTNVIITNIDESIMESINIFPNPTKDDIYVELPLNEFTSVEVKIYSVTGKLVYNASQNNVSKLSISTENWDKGLYFIQLISNNQTIIEKIIKQ